MSDKIRKADGYAYHHRFNALTWSTYDLCIDELTAFVAKFGEKWFREGDLHPENYYHPENY